MAGFPQLEKGVTHGKRAQRMNPVVHSCGTGTRGISMNLWFLRYRKIKTNKQTYIYIHREKKREKEIHKKEKQKGARDREAELEVAGGGSCTPSPQYLLPCYVN